MRESRGRILTPYSMKAERNQRRRTPFSMKAERNQRRILTPYSMRRGHSQTIRSRMIYWRRISQIRTWGAR